MAKLITIDHNSNGTFDYEKDVPEQFNFYRFHPYPGRLSVIIKLKEHVSKTETLPELIFLHLNMPEFSGWDFPEEFKLIYPQFAKPILI